MSAKRLKPLTCVQRRDLLASDKADEEVIRAYGDACFAEGSYFRAFEFYERIRAADGLEACRRAAIEQAEHALLWRLDHVEGFDVSEEDWRRCMSRAAEIGKDSARDFIARRLGDAPPPEPPTDNSDA